MKYKHNIDRLAKTEASLDTITDEEDKVPFKKTKLSFGKFQVEMCERQSKLSEQLFEARQLVGLQERRRWRLRGILRHHFGQGGHIF